MVQLQSEMSSKKINGIYSTEFKLKVLVYYFKNGGDSKFGLKSRTAQHFAIDQKTVSRMTCNRELVRTALRRLDRSGCKLPAGKSLEEHESVLDQHIINTSPSKPVTVNGVSSSSQEREPTVIDAPIIELPEDPDYSVLKKTIDSSVSDVAAIASLLVTGTEEVRRILTNECDLIFECKVCRNLFRSVVNLLAHKRIYCQDDYAEVRSLFRKNTNFESSSEAPTIIVEPKPPSEPPPDSVLLGEPGKPSLKIDRIASRLAFAKLPNLKKVDQQPSSSTDTGSAKYFENIETISENRKNGGRDCTVLLQDITDVPKAVYQTCLPPKPKERIQPMREAVEKYMYREKGETLRIEPEEAPLDDSNETFGFEQPVSSFKSPSAKPVQDSSARESSAKPRESTKSSRESSAKPVRESAKSLRESSSNTIKESSSKPAKESSSKSEKLFSKSIKSTETLSYPCSSCSQRFTNVTERSSHVQKVHGVERSIYTCPICHVLYLTIRGCVKHLARVHKKKKRQRDRLRQVITKRVQKKVLTTSEIWDINSKNNLQGQGSDDDSDLGETAKALKLANIGQVKSEVVEPVIKATPEVPKVMDHYCVKCGQCFQNSCGLGSHLVHCKYKISGSSQAESGPEKKIGIQIRKDYTKVASPSSQPHINSSDLNSSSVSKVNLEIQARIKEICNVKKRYCIPCKRSYNSNTILKRHAAQHLGWTRFSCAKCSYRSYERYMVGQHCTNEHNVNFKEVEKCIKNQENIGEFRFYLTSNNSNSAEDNVEESIGNGYQSSTSECSASVASEDSFTFKSEPESQEIENANVAYRELIESVDMEVEQKALEAKTDEKLLDVKTEVDPNYDSDSKVERPQRTRKVIEKKDFVYESNLRPLSRNDDEINKPCSAISLRVRNISAIGLVNDRTGKRRGISPASEPLKKKLNTGANKIGETKEIKQISHNKEDSTNQSSHSSSKEKSTKQSSQTTSKQESIKQASQATSKEETTKQSSQSSSKQQPKQSSLAISKQETTKNLAPSNPKQDIKQSSQPTSRQECKRQSTQVTSKQETTKQSQSNSKQPSLTTLKQDSTKQLSNQTGSKPSKIITAKIIKIEKDKKEEMNSQQIIKTEKLKIEKDKKEEMNSQQIIKAEKVKPVPKSNESTTTQIHVKIGKEDPVLIYNLAKVIPLAKGTAKEDVIPDKNKEQAQKDKSKNDKQVSKKTSIHDFIEF